MADLIDTAKSIFSNPASIVSSVSGLVGSNALSSAASALGLSALSGGVSGGSSAGASSVPQSERLFTVRSRQAALSPTSMGAGGSRGTRSKLKILTSDEARTRSRTQNSISPTDQTINKLLSPEGFTDFLVTGFSVAYDEKVQITQTFGDTDVAYYFGKAPVIYNIQGMLFDDIDNNWFVPFLNAYGTYLRGTQSAQNYELIQLDLPSAKIIGSIMNLRFSADSLRDTDIPFSFQILAKSITPYSIPQSGVPVDNRASLLNFGQAAGFTNFTSISEVNSLTQKISNIYGAIQNPFATTSAITSAIGGLSGVSTVIGLGSGALGSIPGLSNLASLGSGSIGSLMGNVGALTSGIGLSNIGGSIGSILGGSNVMSAATSAIAGFNPSSMLGSIGNLGASFGGGPGLGGFGGLPGLGGFPGITGGGGAVLPNAANPFYAPGGIGGAFGSNTTSLMGFQSSLFSPVYGVLSSLTRIVGGTTGTLANILSAFTTPVNTVLRDIQSIAGAAVAVTRLVENSINSVLSIPARTIANVDFTLMSFTNAAGVISRAPETISDQIKRMVKGGNIGVNSAFLTAGGSAPGSKTALLNSGVPYTPQQGAFL